MSNLEYQYAGMAIDFSFREDLMVNATEMAKVFDKDLHEFMRSESFKKLIHALEKTNIRPDRTGNFPVRSDEPEHIEGMIKHKTADLVPLVIINKGGKYGGSTWVHRYIAIELAMWLDVDFKIWLLTIIDRLLSSYASERRTLVLRKRNVDNQLMKIFEETENPEVIKIQKLLKEKNQIKGEEFNLNKMFKKGIEEL